MPSMAQFWRDEALCDWQEELSVFQHAEERHSERCHQILTENPDVEFVQIVINYFDWNSSFIQSGACCDVIRRHGKKIVVMEPVKGGCLAALPEESEQKLKNIDPDASPASWALRFAASQEGVLTVSSPSTEKRTRCETDAVDP